MKKHSLVVIAIISIFSTSAAYATESSKKEEAAVAAGSVVLGAAAGGATFAAVGSGGLAIAGTAISIGAAPFIAGGAVVGMAGYGSYKLLKSIFSDSEKNEKQDESSKDN
ncbi:MAG: hypothetical protein RBR77_10415 [Thauera sp.]|jgi:hypothetical protein|nr:hypothetical protein [Thauera sp.]